MRLMHGLTLSVAAATALVSAHLGGAADVRSGTARVYALIDAVSKGTVTLERDPRNGYLAPVLRALGLPLESQMLIFSKTGVQRDHTGPGNPRALFFDDSLVVGYIHGAPLLEIAAHDPLQGETFFSIEQEQPKPLITRSASCLNCHVAASTLHVPGLIARSNMVNAEGGIVSATRTNPVNHTTPIAERWGGWLVTGEYATPPYVGVGHRGNVTVAAHDDEGAVITSNKVFTDWMTADYAALGYPARDSDIGAIMVFDHQAHATNLITQLGLESRAALARGTASFTAGPLRRYVDDLADYLLFVGEVPPPGRVMPRSGLAERILERFPTDRAGRSLAELQLSGRLLKYPCSYMIYSDGFDALPADARTAVYARLWAVLSGADPSPRYRHLSRSDRLAVLQILRDTKSDLPAEWRAAIVPRP